MDCCTVAAANAWFSASHTIATQRNLRRSCHSLCIHPSIMAQLFRFFLLFFLLFLQNYTCDQSLFSMLVHCAMAQRQRKNEEITQTQTIVAVESPSAMIWTKKKSSQEGAWTSANDRWMSSDSIRWAKVRTHHTHSYALCVCGILGGMRQSIALTMTTTTKGLFQFSASISRLSSTQRINRKRQPKKVICSKCSNGDDWQS